jgi:two-component system, LytTR family, response regulator
MDKIRCILIEDELPAREKLEGFIRDVPFLKLEHMFSSAITALEWLRDNNVELIFLDLQLGVLNGFDFLERISNPPMVIITTAFQEYAVESFNFNVYGYLLKPYSFKQFLQAVTKAKQLRPEQSQINHESLFLKTEYRVERVSLSDILYIEGMKDYLKIITVEKKLMSLLSFKKVLQHLPSNNFVRVHNSFIVAIDKVESIERNQIKIGERLIPISNGFKESFYNAINSRLL